MKMSGKIFRAYGLLQCYHSSLIFIIGIVAIIFLMYGNQQNKVELASKGVNLSGVKYLDD